MNMFGHIHQESLKFDKRLVQMNEKSGLLAPGEYEDSLKNLPDQEHNAAPVTLKGDGAIAASAPVIEDVASVAQPEPILNNTFGGGSTSNDDGGGNTGGGGFFGGL